LESLKSQQGVSRYKVVIDETTTTQADIENNTIRGKIYLQPVRVAEFIALDFNINNQIID
jgi:phage tail sheath protein FI